MLIDLCRRLYRERLSPTCNTFISSESTSDSSVACQRAQGGASRRSAQIHMPALTMHSFPGSQPVSFEHSSLELLEQEKCALLPSHSAYIDVKCSFWVCEKSDGVRVLVFIVTPGDGMQEVYLVRSSPSAFVCQEGLRGAQIDRKDDFYQVGGFYFPHWLDPKNGLSNTLLDGELVIDVDRKTGQVRSALFDELIWRLMNAQQTMRLLAFDLLVIGQDNIMKKSLLSRYGVRLRTSIGSYIR